MIGVIKLALGFFLLVLLLLFFFLPLLMGLAVGLALGGWHIPIWTFIGFIAMALAYGKS